MFQSRAGPHPAPLLYRAALPNFSCLLASRAERASSHVRATPAPPQIAAITGNMKTQAAKYAANPRKPARIAQENNKTAALSVFRARLRIRNRSSPRIATATILRRIISGAKKIATPSTTMSFFVNLAVADGPKYTLFSSWAERCAKHDILPGARLRVL
jgi:hypothetical protein